MSTVKVIHDDQPWGAKMRDGEDAPYLREVFAYETERGERDDHALAEEAFHLFNIEESDERALEYRSKGLRSLSVGDIVEVDGKRLRCGSFGWKEVE